MNIRITNAKQQPNDLSLISARKRLRRARLKTGACFLKYLKTNFAPIFHIFFVTLKLFCSKRFYGSMLGGRRIGHFLVVVCWKICNEFKNVDI